VDQRVLIPRPETELLVEQALKIIHNHPIKTIADIGTGSGAIAISIAKTIDFSSHSGNSMPFPSQGKLASQDRAVPDRPLVPIIFASDISTDALAVASLNARKHCVAEYITFLQGDLLEPLPTSIELLIANLPYVTSLEVNQMPSAKYEPVLALDGGKSGLDQIFRIAEQIKGRVNSGGCILLEIGMGQSQAVVEHMNKLYPSAKIETLPDLAGIDRVVIISEFHA